MPKVREAIRIVEGDGWYHVRTRGSHRQYRHPVKPGKVTISGHPGEDLPTGTWIGIQLQAGLRRRGR
ncbi:MAG: type II toxin-antitoxin system HicA family toxin [Chloroflexota bacterium]|nr:type II toxin-antitoxin system HicA family toxin [Chloroflexota bacterium]MDE2886557.1 type II toxin-antitoxin system HicA family toxin [Chloroflexota bacterium]